ncbi:hypothetical protein BDZ85DRAFT_307119 [Elsinoe ampelina]|uniref:Filamentation protein n=1 Tax=Elsinoe ampelina TaxID=302913 RepID=A0A6A6FZ54_9PEZI|nr:hypothetical protein BDZ85DRAFT_307119 [Elsinoe ampelina]
MNLLASDTEQTRQTDKATRYIDQLNVARLNGAWGEVRELIRKVQKHAPSPELSDDNIPRPISTGSQQTNKHSGAIEKLSQAVQADQTHAQDVFGARVCLAHAQWLQGQWSEVVQTLAQENWSAAQQGSLTPILLYTLLKGKYVLGNAYEKNGANAEAEKIYESAIPIIARLQQTVLEHHEAHRWASRVLGELCALELPGQDKQTLESMNRALVRYRSWSVVGRDAPLERNKTQSSSRIWRAYHTLLADVFRSNLIYTGSEKQPLAVSTGGLSRFTRSEQRKKQFAELISAAKGYEAALMKETEFPAASETNEAFERFADEVVATWRIAMSSEWSKADLEHPGKLGCTRSVLEFLYRAASRTFHSTPILRHLITVHASLAEFDLATKALDSYIEIISKGKARAEKTGKHELGLDNDDIVLYTVSEAIKFLCLYGDSKHALKAYELGQTVSSWLHQKRPRSSSVGSKDYDPSLTSEKVEAEQFSTQSALAAAYKGIGQSKATWARYVQETKLRGDLQDEADRSLVRSLHLAGQSDPDLEIAYLLAYSQAERRSIADAMETVTTALSQDKKRIGSSLSQSPAEVAFEAQRRRLPLLHLLVLLLSANNQYDTAVTVCETALEETIDAARACERVINGQAEGDDEDYSYAELPSYLAENLLDTEKECLIQLKISEMELLNLIENVAYAASKRQELLKMYEQLFGNPRSKSAAPTTDANTISSMPKSRPGTVKSFRESIFGRPKSSRRSLDKNTFDVPPPVPDHPLLAKSNEKADTSTQPDPPILLKVTNEDGEQVEDESRSKLGRISLSIRRGRQRHSHDVAKLKEEQDQSAKRSASDPPPSGFLNGTPPKSRKDKSRSRERRASKGSPKIANTATGQQSVLTNGITEKDESKAIPAPELRILDHDERSRKNPAPFLTSHRRQVHHVSVLVDIWLFISVLFTKEDLYDEAKAAVQEAHQLIELLKTIQAGVESSARAWQHRGWGLGRSISRLTADACAERGRIDTLMSAPHSALDFFERGLSFETDHSATITFMSSILLDIYEEIIAQEPPSSRDLVAIASSASSMDMDNTLVPKIKTSQSVSDVEQNANQAPRRPKTTDPSPEELNRIAARDRAYMLLSSLTKLGEGWDNAEAWFHLSRAHELMGQTQKAENCLWWVVQLEDARPVRPWRVAGIMQ